MNDRALEQQFLDRAKALTNVAEVYRCLQVTMLICDMVAFGVRGEAKIFEAAYGEPSRHNTGTPTYRNRYEFTRCPCAFGHLAEQAERCRWQGLRSFGPFEMQLRPASAGLLETPRHFWPWRMAKPISRGWLRSSFIPALPSMAAEQTKA